jgi:hypothetical protein
MSAALGLRLAALAAAALLAGVFGIALSQAGRSSTPAAMPEPAAGPWGGWTTALAGVALSLSSQGRASDCGWLVRRSTLGVLHPVLPCGARVFVEYGGRRALTRVVGHRPVAPADQLDVTPHLARILHLEGVRRVRWAFAR